MKSIIIAVLVLLSGDSFANDQKTFAKNAIKTFGLVKYKSKHLKDPNFKIAASTIYTILANTQELRIHQMNGETDNQTFIHKDGHREAVFDKEGKAVESCPNKATYNYYHPFEAPLGHFTADILPWLMWGSCTDDVSTQEQRIEAYVLDFREGFDRNAANGNGFYLPNEFRFKKYGQREGIGFFLRALDIAGYNISNFVPANINNKDEQERFFSAIKSGMTVLIKNS